MRSPVPGVVVVLVFAAAPVAAADHGPDVAATETDAVREARARYAGTWRVVSIEADGNRSAGDGRAIVVTNDPDGSWTLAVDGKPVSRGTSRIDPLASPPEIDIEITDGDGKGGTMLGIYKVTETSRRLCFRGADGWRPREFATSPGCGAVLVDFEKQ